MYPKAEIVLYEYKVPGTRHSIYIPFFLITFFRGLQVLKMTKKINGLRRKIGNY